MSLAGSQLLFWFMVITVLVAFLSWAFLVWVTIGAYLDERANPDKYVRLGDGSARPRHPDE